MIFSELYSAYYNTVAAIIKAAIDHPVSDKEINQIVADHAFEESMLTIPSALAEERWQLLRADGTTPIKQVPTMPLTLLEKRWLKAISLDPRMKLFQDLSDGHLSAMDFSQLDVEPLFKPEDIVVFDKYNDGDDYEDPEYIKNFRLIMDAIINGYPLDIKMKSGRGKIMKFTMMPQNLEYSEKDDKFRLNGRSTKYGGTVNLSRIISCKKRDADSFAHGGQGIEDDVAAAMQEPRHEQRLLVFDLIDHRNGLERILLHFAHFKKEVESLDGPDGDKYRVHLYYDKDDETEILIRILSFGPMIQVLEPARFVDLIKDRLKKQRSCAL